MKVLKDEWVESSDGVRICADVYLPDGDGPFPALYAVGPYQKDLAYLPDSTAFRFRETGPIEWWVDECGYAYVLADCRGTGKSEGTFGLFSAQEQQDYHDTIEWIAEQPWSTGKVGMIGESGYSVNQWLAAATRPPHLTCSLIYNAFTDMYRDAMFHGGVFSMGFINFWQADNIRASATVGSAAARRPGGVDYDIVGNTLLHPTVDEFWRERSPVVADIAVPTLVVAFWSNIGLHLRGTLAGYEQLTSTKRLLALATPDPQGHNFDTDFLTEHLKPWYDHWLKGEDNGALDVAPVRIEVQHGELRDEEEWPLARAVPTPFYLDPTHSDAVESLNQGRLSPTAPDASSARATTEYTYPQPSWTVGTTVIENGIPHPVKGILTFTSEPLEEDLELTGPIAAVLYVESDQTDTEFHVKVSEQLHVPKIKDELMTHLAHAPPPAVMVTRGWLRASHRELDTAASTELTPRHSHTDPTPITPGEVVRYDVEVWPTSYLFRKGNRIRVEIANGDSMVADGLFHHYYGHKCGTDLIHHSPEHPSHVVLPIVPRE